MVIFFFLELTVFLFTFILLISWTILKSKVSFVSPSINIRDQFLPDLIFGQAIAMLIYYSEVAQQNTWITVPGYLIYFALK